MLVHLIAELKSHQQFYYLATMQVAIGDWTIRVEECCIPFTLGPNTLVVHLDKILGDPDTVFAKAFVPPDKHADTYGGLVDLSRFIKQAVQAYEVPLNTSFFTLLECQKGLVKLMITVDQKATPDDELPWPLNCIQIDMGSFLTPGHPTASPV